MKGWFLYNLAHKNSSIKSSDGQAWIRVLGFFPSKNRALEHAKKISAFDKGLEIRICPSEEFRVMLRDRYHDKPGELDMITRERETSKHEFLSALHIHKRKEAFRETAANAESRQMGKLDYRVEDRIEVIQPQKVDIAAAASEPKPELSAKPEVGRIPESLELRMQKFAALAFIPDYEHEEISKNALDSWENKCEENYIKNRNTLLINALKEKKMPSSRSLMEHWVSVNPPPKGTNVYGQKLLNSCIWERGGEKVQDTEVEAWMATFKIEQERVIWHECGIKKPERTEAIKTWLAENPLPEIDSAEPCVSFLFVANTEDEVKAWIDKCSIKQHDVGCVSMYEWIKISNVWGEKIKRTFREPLVSKLYEKREFQSAEAKRLEGLVKEIEIKNEVS